MRVKLELDTQEANLVLLALAKLPYESVAALISNIQKQANSQLQDTVEPEVE